MRSAAVVCAFLMLAAAGCGAGARSPNRGFSAGERAWAEETVDWWQQIAGDLGFLQRFDAFDRENRPELGRIRERLAECLGGVSTAPSDRLGVALARRRAVCRATGEAAAVVQRVLGNGLSSSAIAALSNLNATIASGLAATAAELDSLSLSRRPLGRRHGGDGTSHVDPVLTAASARVADGRSVEVRCWSRDDWRAVIADEGALTDGDVSVDSTGAFAIIETATLHLQEEDCARLAELKAGRVEDRSRLSWSAGLLSHEIQHLVGPGGSEAETECAGLQHTAAVAEALGAARQLAGELARLQWEESYPELPDEYRSSACRPGGPLDQHPESTSWPTS